MEERTRRPRGCRRVRVVVSSGGPTFARGGVVALARPRSAPHGGGCGGPHERQARGGGGGGPVLRVLRWSKKEGGPSKVPTGPLAPTHRLHTCWSNCTHQHDVTSNAAMCERKMRCFIF